MKRVQVLWGDKIYKIEFLEIFMNYETTKRENYEKPVIKKIETMNFPLEIIASATGEKVLHLDKQCSSCHSCR